MEDKNETIIPDENVKEENGLVIKGFDTLQKRTSTKTDIFTNITDQKKIFNLESKVDNLLNDLEGSTIEVKEVLIKRFEKPIKEPEVNENGEIIKDREITMSCILIDTNNVSYATGSKVFTIQMMRYLEMFGIKDSFLIKITKNKQESGNKTLGFELV